MNVIQPTAALRPGDVVKCVAASSALNSSERLHQGASLLTSWGLKVEQLSCADRSWGYLAGSDCERRHDLEPESTAELFACARGGWGAARLLERDIQWQSGWLLGFSDVTALLWARLASGFAGGVHGPLLTTLPDEPEWSRDRLRRLLFGEEVPDLQGKGTGGGRATGPLVVANLTVATHLLGTRFVPDLKGAILVLEDVGEAPYRIDRMLTQWRLSGILQQLAGIGFGHFEGCDEDERPPAKKFSLAQVLEDRTADLDLPKVFDLPVGHRPGNAALPLGVMACMDGDTGILSLLP